MFDYTPPPSPGEVYEMCALQMGDGSTLGTLTSGCADVSTPNGVEINGYEIQSCDLPHGWVCFTTVNGPGPNEYTIHSGQGAYIPPARFPEDPLFPDREWPEGSGLITPEEMQEASGDYWD